MTNFSALLLFLVPLSLCSAHRILVLFAMPSKSHSILGNGIARNLLEAGNEVTLITPFPWKNPPPNLKQVDVSSLLKELNTDDILNISSLLEKKGAVHDGSFVFKMMLTLSRKAIDHENVQKLLLDKNQKFDAVVAEWMFSELYSGVAQIFGCPYIMFSPIDHLTLVLDLMDEYPNPAYTPNSIHVGHLPPFDFKGRVTELVTQIRDILFRRLFFYSLETSEYEAAINPILKKLGKPIVSFDEARKNVSLILYNSHVSLNYAPRLPWNVLPIGGYHIDTNVEPLPKDLQDLMDNSKHGVIYFSMGSNLKSKNMPEILKKSLLKMFGTLKQTVIWKFEENLADVPKNVKILQWAPQPSILSHPNLAMFITHGGLLSTTETVHFGVPVIGIPVFADQFTNVDRSVNKGFAIRVDLSYTMADELKLAIEEMLANPKYKQKAKELSVIYHHRVVPPGKLLAHGVEHVILTGGAAHLRSPAFLTPWYQKLYLDLAGIILAILLIAKVLCKKLYSKICSKKQVTQDRNKKKKN